MTIQQRLTTRLLVLSKIPYIHRSFLKGFGRRSLVSGSVKVEKTIKEMFVEGIEISIRKSLRHLYDEQKSTSLEKLPETAESLVNIQGTSLRTEESVFKK